MFEGRPKKSLGQSFLISERVAIAEAEHAHDKVVLEMGPGKGLLTKELLQRAKKVIAVEKDQRLFTVLATKLKSKKLKLIHNDFFEVSEEDLELKDVDIMIANIPYQLSSKTIEWLSEKRMQAVLCLQKEFVDHMMAKEDTDNYSRLSVISGLSFRLTKIMSVSSGSFRPMPKVDSTVIYLKPIDVNITAMQRKIIRAMMQHKKKTVRNAMMDSEKDFNKSKQEMLGIMESIKEKEQRVFKLPPEVILSIAKELETHFG